MGSALDGEWGEAREGFSEKVVLKAEERGKVSQGERWRKLVVDIFIKGVEGRSQEPQFVV